MNYLRQSTATAVLIGPFLDSGDGVTPETALTVTNFDADLYKKSDTHPLTKSDLTITASGGSNDCAHVANGYYSLELTTTDTNTVGRLRLTVNISGAVPVWEEFTVLPAAVYDSWVAGSDYLQVDTIQIEGSDATDQINSACDTALTDYDPPTKAEMDTAHSTTDGLITTVDGVVDAIKGVTDNLPDSGALTTIDGNVDAIKAVTDNLPESGALTTIDGNVDAIKAVTDNLPDSGALTTIDGNVDAILADTGTDGVVIADNGITAAKIATDAIGSDEISAAGANKIADHIIRRSFQNACDSSDGDTKTFRSLLGFIGKGVNKVAPNGTNLEIFEDDDVTVLGTQAMTTSGSAEAIIALDTN